MTRHIDQAMKSPLVRDSEDEESRAQLQTLARLIAQGRAQPIRTRVVEPNGVTGQDRFSYEMTDRQTEEPFRVLEQLRTLCRSLAWIHGRTRLTDHELELARRVAVSSIAVDRAAAMACIAREPEINQSTLADLLGRKPSGTQKLIEELRFLGLVRIKEVNGRRVYQVSEAFARDLAKPGQPLDHIADLKQ
jgi:hypothetical protein